MDDITPMFNWMLPSFAVDLLPLLVHAAKKVARNAKQSIYSGFIRIVPFVL
jgi:hypothetical protein